ncbi:MAG: site-2 protease family protein [archaeon]
MNRKELIQLVIAWLVISICFALRLNNYDLFSLLGKKVVFNFSELLKFLLISLVITATSFIIHEMAHKYTAIHFGAKGQFVMWSEGLIISLVFTAIFGFMLIIPGAVYIFGKDLSRKEYGIVSLAGPLSNIIMGLIFIGLSFSGILPAIIISYGIMINFWLAFFNLLPVWQLDGKKIFVWNIFVWLLMILVAGFFVFIPYVI